MKPPGFPFPALVGLDALKMALQLAAIDRRLSVLIRGDKGAGKSTAARGLVDLLQAGAPFINLPIGATEDRLLGGLDVEKAMKGNPALKPGLLTGAHGGVLYVDEVNLLPDHLADALLDAVASGVHVLEREGFSISAATEFVMVGSMNPEEGALRPQLLDRFALAVDVVAPMEPSIRRAVIERRLAYDANAVAFAETWRGERVQMARQLDAARAHLARVRLPDDILDLIAERVAAQRIRSLRADLAIVRGSRALAALEGAPAVTASHVDAMLPLALAHRLDARSRDPREPPPLQAPPPRRRDDEPPPDVSASTGAAPERIFAPIHVAAPRLVIEQPTARAGASSVSATSVARGAAIRARPSADPRELDVRATLVHAVARQPKSQAEPTTTDRTPTDRVATDRTATAWAATARATTDRTATDGATTDRAEAGLSGTPRIEIGDLHERIRAPLVGTRFVFIVDSSGSHGVQERMRLVKGAVNGLLERAHGRHDEVMMIGCRGAAASVLVEPTPALAEVQRALEYLPTGGRTPLAHALELAAGYVTDATVLVLVTDGHANVPSRSEDAWADALAAARAIACPSLVIDSEDARDATGRPRELAEAMRGTHVRLAELDDAAVLRVIKDVS